MPRGPSCVQVRAQVKLAAWSRLRRAPASAGAQNFRGRRHLPLLGLRRRGEQAVIKARCAERPPPHPCARPSYPARPMHGSRTFPPPCTPRFNLTPFCPCVAQDDQCCPSTSTKVEGGAPRRQLPRDIESPTWTDYARVELRALQTREPAAVAQMLFRL